jgi:LPS-assembly protein
VKFAPWFNPLPAKFSRRDFCITSDKMIPKATSWISVLAGLPKKTHPLTLLRMNGEKLKLTCMFDPFMVSLSNHQSFRSDVPTRKRQGAKRKERRARRKKQSRTLCAMPLALSDSFARLDLEVFLRSRSGFLINLLVGTLFLCGAPLWAQIGQPRDRAGEKTEINVTADKLTAGDGGNQIEASGKVEIKRQLTTLKADEVRVNRETQDVEAKGKVSVDDPEWKVKSADSMQFNMEKETGEMQNADLFLEQGHLSMSGRRLQKFGGQTYHVDEGFFTTCLCESGAPSWKISADTMDLNREGLAIIRNGYFYVLDVPVFYLPYGFFPVTTERQTGFLIPKIGQSSREGFRFQVPFFWALSKSTDATIAWDVETRARVGLLGEFRTMFSRDSDFQLNASYFNEGLRKNEQAEIGDRTIADLDIPVNRWNIFGTHRYTTASDWLTFSDIAAYSDDLFARELIERFDLPRTKESDIRRSRFGASRFGVFKGGNDTYIKGEWNFYQDFIQRDATTFQRTPQVALWGRRFLSGFPLEFRWRGEGVNYIRRERGDGLRFDLRPELVLPLRMASVFGSLSVAPRETVYHLYSPVKASDHNVSRELIEMRGNVGTSFSRIFGVNVLGSTGVKHVIEPELSYLFIPGTDQSRIPIMDGIDRIRRRNILTFAVSNRVWGKFANPLAPAASDKDIELLNPAIANVRQLGSLRFALSYDIDQERRGGDSLSDLDLNLRLMPLGYMTIRLDGGVNPGPWQVTNARATFDISDPRPLPRRSLDPDFNRPNSLSFSYHYLASGPNAFLADNANFNVDTLPVCPSTSIPPDPRCAEFRKSVVGNLGANLFYHVLDNALIFLNGTYNVRDTRFLGFRAATKILSSCECWSVTFGLSHSINPSKTTFDFNFNLLGLAAQRSTLQ